MLAELVGLSAARATRRKKGMAVTRGDETGYKDDGHGHWVPEVPSETPVNDPPNYPPPSASQTASPKPSRPVNPPSDSKPAATTPQKQAAIQAVINNAETLDSIVSDPALSILTPAENQIPTPEQFDASEQFSSRIIAFYKSSQGQKFIAAMSKYAPKQVSDNSPFSAGNILKAFNTTPSESVPGADVESIYYARQRVYGALMEQMNQYNETINKIKSGISNALPLVAAITAPQLSKVVLTLAITARMIMNIKKMYDALSKPKTPKKQSGATIQRPAIPGFPTPAWQNPYDAAVAASSGIKPWTPPSFGPSDPNAAADAAFQQWKSDLAKQESAWAQITGGGSGFDSTIKPVGNPIDTFGPTQTQFPGTTPSTPQFITGLDGLGEDLSLGGALLVAGIAALAYIAAGKK